MQFFAKHKLLCVTLLLLSITATPNAYAYLDPGTGSVMLQGILAGIASGLAILKIYWQRLKNFFTQMFRKKTSQKNQKPTDHPDSSV